jgi:hypothetical protein
MFRLCLPDEVIRNANAGTEILTMRWGCCHRPVMAAAGQLKPKWEAIRRCLIVQSPDME